MANTEPACGVRVAEIVLRLTGNLATETDLHRVVNAVLAEVRRGLGAELAHVCAVEPDGDGARVLRLVGAANIPPELLPRLERFTLDDGFLAARAAATRELQLAPGPASLDPRATLARELLEHAGCQSMISVPLFVADELVGVLTYALRAAHEFDSAELSLVRLVSAVLAAAMYRARLHERLVREAVERARAERALLRSERELRIIVEGASDGVFLADPDGRYTGVNPAGARMLGYAPEELVGKTIAQLIRPEDLPRLVAERERVFAGETVTGEWVMLRKDGREINVEVSTRLLPDGRWLGLTRDVTERRREQDALAESEARFRLTVDNAPIGMALVGLDGRFLRVNAALAEMVGYAPRELEALHFQDITHPDDLSTDLALAEKLLRGEIPRYSLPKRYVRKDGSVIHVVMHGAVVRDPRGQPVHYIAQVEDVTEQLRAEREREELLHQLQSERAWLRAVIDRSPVGVLMAEGVAAPKLTPNRQLEEMLRLPVATMEDVARNTVMFRKPDGREVDAASRPLLRALRGETVVREELTMTPPGRGTTLHVRVNAAPIIVNPEEGVTGAVVLVDDITAEKELERLREEWISVIAHDLRQPLNAIATHAQLLARRLTPDVEGAPSVQHILSAARRLGRMVNDLLETSRLEAHRLHVDARPTEIGPFAHTVAERMLGEAAGHPVRVVAEDNLPPVMVDPERVEQVLGNLISNAAKYGDPGTEIAVDLRRCDGEALVSVINHGRGIPPEEIPRLFSRFQRSSSTKGSGIPGLGLGLYIARGLVEAHGGRIWAESEPGRETAIRFTLPLAAERVTAA